MHIYGLMEKLLKNICIYLKGSIFGI